MVRSCSRTARGFGFIKGSFHWRCALTIFPLHLVGNLPPGFGVISGTVSPDPVQRPACSKHLPYGFGMLNIPTYHDHDVHRRSTTRTLSLTPRNIRKRQLYQEKKLVRSAVSALATDSDNADELLTRALQTRAGAKKWPRLSAEISQGDKDAVVVRALSQTISSLGGKRSMLRAPLLGRLLGKCSVRLSPAYLKTQLGLKHSCVKNAKRYQKQASENILDLSYNTSTRPLLRVHIMVQCIIEDFFREHTHVDSKGCAKASATRKLTLQKWELHCIFYAQYPSLLRLRASQCPAPRTPSTPLTNLQRDVRTALWATTLEDFDELIEFQTRLKEAKAKYVEHLARMRLLRAGVSVPTQKVGRKAMPNTFDPAQHRINVPTQATFFRVLQKRKVKFTMVENATRCPIHDDGPAQEKQLELVKEALMCLTQNVQERYTQEQAMRKQGLLGQKRKLDKQVQLYRRHCLQYKIQRERIKSIEASCGVDECVCYRDFVNDHDEMGSKVCNLVLVKRQRLEPGGEMRSLNIHNFGDAESCDSYWTADVFDFHLDKGDAHHSGMFDDVQNITIVGDHGPHFSANETVYNESCFFQKYGKTVTSIFLCSYHAYNYCDGAGVVPKRLSKQRQREGAGPIGASEYRHAVNMSNYSNHVAFFFEKVNRSENVFSSRLEPHTNLRSMCDFKYSWITEDGSVERQPGVVLIRYVSDDNVPYQVVDLLRRKPDEEMCESCSSRLQRPVRHLLDGSNCRPVGMSTGMIIDRRSLPTPDPARICGLQVTRKRKKRSRSGAKAKAKKGEAKDYPCMSPLCSMEYKTPGGANRHMETMHPGEDLQLYPKRMTKVRLLKEGKCCARFIHNLSTQHLLFYI